MPEEAREKAKKRQSHMHLCSDDVD